ncbi:nischarin isoform X3 [Aethina tumida]|uniref:nischarin isoform X3 n=1 Tax=Aethina tumida TaxID=116153 RepID=UPI00096B621C|nr:nischarin isoform X3 [Aethina tumida]XP_049818065.1 nischarin isoform X3 [Aethina tumida]XP_049818066.1 nischarin isoform X3 [Aethina tumida]
MASFWNNYNETVIDITGVEEISNITYYIIRVTVGDIKWTVSHRYNDFFEMHNKLVIDHGVSKDILPSKKVIRNKCPVFIETRRKGLENYLKNVLHYLKRTMPKIFVKFLDFHLYDVFFLLQDMADKLFNEADSILDSTKSYTLTPIELHAVSEFKKNPFPLVEGATRFDLSPVLDLCSQLISLQINGITGNYLKSNIFPNSLSFELSSFKALKNLHCKNVSFDMIYSLGNLRNTVQKLVVNNTFTTSIASILQCDVIHKNNVEGSEVWSELEEVDLSNNNLTEIDRTINLIPKLRTLILNDNKISTITNLSELSNLTSLSVSNNLITICNQLHTKVGNILYLNLSQNSIVSLKGFNKLYSLETLDLNSNKITDVEELSYIGDLPNLENLILTGNNVATSVDYRIKVLEYFGDRSKDICLDNEKPSQSELDKVSVLRALRIVKEGKTPNLSTNHHF